MIKYTGLRRIDQLFGRAKETVNDRGNRVRHLLMPGDPKFMCQAFLSNGK